MAIREFKYTVTPDSIAGSTVSKGGVQGERNATKLIFELSASLQNKLSALVAEGDNKSFYYRFDCYDGAGGMYSTAPVEFDPSNETEFSHLIAKKQTEFGGTIQVYFVITLVNGKSTEDTADDTTELELYSYSVKLMLKALPNGAETEGEDYESITTLAMMARKAAEDAQASVITSTDINENGELVITYADGTTKNIGNVKGDKGEKGDIGNSGVHVGTDEPTDENINVWVNPDGIADETPSGGSGADGFSPTVEITEIDGGHKVSVTDVSGTKSFDVLDGQNGADGINGKDGVSATHSWDGTVLTVTSANGTTSADLKGDKGETGATGPQGPKGEDGYSPIKGIDYFTESEKSQIIQEVLDAIGTPIVGTVDENNNITLSGDLKAGTYTLKYIDENGYSLEIGEVIIDEENVEANYTNQIPISTDTDGSVFNSVGYANGKRLNSSGGISDATGYSVTGFIPFVTKDIIRTNANVCTSTDESGYSRVTYYDVDKNYLGEFKITPNMLNSYSTYLQVSDNGELYFSLDLVAMSGTGYSDIADAIKYIRICVNTSLNSTSVITVNEEIT